MSAQKIISQCRNLGINLVAKDGRLVVDAPPGKMTPDIRVKLANNKTEILDALRIETPAIRAEILTAYRSAYWGHVDTCPTCRTGMSNAIHCREHNELWQAYDAFRQVFNAGQDRAQATPDPPADTRQYLQRQ